MNNRLFQEMANAHIIVLEHEADNARLARAQGKSSLWTLPGLAPRFVAQLRRHPGSHGIKLRASTDLLLVGPPQEFDPVAELANPACEGVGSENHATGAPGHWSTRDDATLQQSLPEREFASKKRRRDMDSRRVNAS